MKTLLSCLFILTTSLRLFGQSTYFIAANGNDNNNGTKNSPFHSIDKLNTINLGPGDIIYFNRGDVFRGELNIVSSGAEGKPIVIGAYGQGNKPIISGSVIVKGWKKVKENIWEAPCPQCSESVTGVSLDGLQLPLGRYPNLDAPNKGYLTVASHVGKTVLVSNDSLTTDWTNGEVVYRPEQWILERSKIIAKQGNTLTLDGSRASYEVKDKWGFFIQDHPATLDENGEWYYDKIKRKILLYYDKGDPNSRSIEATAFSNGINIHNVNYITIQDITLEQTVHHAILAVNSSNLIINNNNVFESGEDGISITGTGSNLLLENNFINIVNNNGVEINGYTNLTFRGNKLTNIGLTAGRGKGKDGQYFGLLYVNNLFDLGSSLIENNKLDSLGYCGIRFQSSNIVIRHNLIYNFDMVKGDGGGIYTFNFTGKTPKPYKEQYIDSNIIINGYAAFEGTYGNKSQESNTNGIYLDYCSTNIQVRGNTIVNCKSSGIYSIAGNHIEITGNTCYNNGAGLYFLDKPAPTNFHDNIVKNNIFYAKTGDQLLERFSVKSEDDIPGVGDFSDNFFSDSVKSGSFLIKSSTKNYKISMDDWNQRFKKDSNSKYINRTPSNAMAIVENPNDVLFYYNDSETTRSISIDGAFKDPKGNVYTNNVNLPPFTSIILLKK